MAQYDLYMNGSGYLIDVQSDLLDRMSTRIVVPCFPVMNHRNQQFA